MSAKYPTALEQLVEILKKIPTVGKKNAERMALAIFLQQNEFIDHLIATLKDVKNNLRLCNDCNNISNQQQCSICLDLNREQDILCVVSTWQDLAALEEHEVFNGKYYVLMNEINLQKNITAKNLNIERLFSRINSNKWKEIIIATSPTINGELTAQYLNEAFKGYSRILITRIAHGLPVGGSINYADQFTLKKSLEGRKKL